MPAPDKKQVKKEAPARRDAVCFEAHDFAVRLRHRGAQTEARLRFAVDHDKVVEISVPEKLAIQLGKLLKPQPLKKSLLPSVAYGKAEA